MTLEDFIKNNRGISSGSSLSVDFLTDIYNRIASNPISLKAINPAVISVRVLG